MTWWKWAVAAVYGVQAGVPVTLFVALVRGGDGETATVGAVSEHPEVQLALNEGFRTVLGTERVVR